MILSMQSTYQYFFKWSFTFLAFATSMGLILEGTQSTQHAERLLGEYGYYFSLLLAVLFCWQLVNFLRTHDFSLKLFLQDEWKTLLALAAVAVLCFISVPPDLRVLADETNLLSVSQSMARTKTTYNVTMGFHYYDNFWPSMKEFAFRPLFFPFCLSLIHGVIGYHYWNGFILNGIVLFAFLSLVYFVIRQKIGVLAAISGVLLTLATPVLVLASTSGGYDVFALLALIVLLLLLEVYATNGHDESFALFWVIGLLCANIRHEGLIFLPVCLFVLALNKKLKPSLFLSRPELYFGLSSLVLVPLAWQKFLAQGHYENPPGVAIFSFDHFMENLTLFFRSQLRLDYQLPYPVLVNWISAALLFIILIKVIFKKRVSSARTQSLISPRLKRIVLSVIFVLIASNAVYFSHFFGRYDHPTQSRLFLGLAVAMSLIPILFTAMFETGKYDKILLVFSVVACILYFPGAGDNRFMNTMTLPRQTRVAWDFMRQVKDRNVLVIWDRPGTFTAMDYGAVNFEYARANSAQIIQGMGRHLYTPYVVQLVQFSTGKPHGGHALDPAIPLEVMTEVQVSAEDYLRISKFK